MVARELQIRDLSEHMVRRSLEKSSLLFLGVNKFLNNCFADGIEEVYDAKSAQLNVHLPLRLSGELFFDTRDVIENSAESSSAQRKQQPGSVKVVSSIHRQIVLDYCRRSQLGQTRGGTEEWRTIEMTR